jgi:citrate synthase
VAIERALRLPPGAAFVLFALGRTVGWIAHALEQQATGQLIRPRAQYTGAQPATDMEAAPTQLGRIIRF